MKVYTLLQLRQGLDCCMILWTISEALSHGSASRNLHCDLIAIAQGCRKCEQEITINLQERMHLVLFVGVQFWWKISFWGEGHPRRMCHVSTCRLKTHKAAFFGRGSGPAAVGEEFGPKFQAHLVHVNMVVWIREYWIDLAVYTLICGIHIQSSGGTCM